MPEIARETTTVIKEVELPPEESSLQNQLQVISRQVEQLQAETPQSPQESQAIANQLQTLQTQLTEINSRLSALEARVTSPEELRELMHQSSSPEGEQNSELVAEEVTIVEAPNPPPVEPPANAGGIQSGVSVTNTGDNKHPKGLLRTLMWGS